MSELSEIKPNLTEDLFELNVWRLIVYAKFPATEVAKILRNAADGLDAIVRSKA